MHQQKLSTKERVADILASRWVDVAFVPLTVVAIMMMGFACARLMDWPWPMVINATASVPRGVWQVSPVTESLEVGAIVVLEPPERARALGCVFKDQVLLKYVVGLPGDRVCVHRGAVSLGKTLIAHTHARSGARHPSPREGCEVVAPGHLWVATPHPRSCDSRFFGAVPVTSVTGLATPRLTWETGRGAAPIFPHVTSRRTP